MDLIGVVIYGALNIAMVLFYLRSRESVYHFPFWAGVISLGWFFPQTVGGYLHAHEFPDYAIADGMFFASLCTLAMWVGYECAFRKTNWNPGWLDVRFDLNRLYIAAAMLCIFGFYFQWKLASLPDELKSATQWSGATVKYLFLASVFRFGFLALWLLYLAEAKWWSPKILVLVIPGLYLLINTAVFVGRRSGMMDLAAYIMLAFWFTRRMSAPRWLLAVGLALGLVLINAIGIYRSIIFDSEQTFEEKVVNVVNADYTSTSESMFKESGSEFKNYILYRRIYEDTGLYDYGLVHWNRLVFNYVPAQIVGREVKDSLMISLPNVNEIAKQEYNFVRKRGTTSTGYKDSFGSFGWLGFVKFLAIGLIMGMLYRHAMSGGLLSQLLYIYMLATAMLAVTHTTHRILFSGWVYFLALGYPVFWWASIKMGKVGRSAGAERARNV